MGKIHDAIQKERKEIVHHGEGETPGERPQGGKTIGQGYKLEGGFGLDLNVP